MIEKIPIVRQVCQIAKCAAFWASRAISGKHQCREAASSKGRCTTRGRRGLTYSPPRCHRYAPHLNSSVHGAQPQRSIEPNKLGLENIAWSGRTLLARPLIGLFALFLTQRDWFRCAEISRSKNLGLLLLRLLRLLISALVVAFSHHDLTGCKIGPATYRIDRSSVKSGLPEWRQGDDFHKSRKVPYLAPLRPI